MRPLAIAALVLLLCMGVAEARPKQFPDRASIVKLVADTMYLEAGGESNEGKLGVAAVISNRSSEWHDIPRIVLARKQFSCWNRRNPRAYRAPDNASYRYCVLVAKDVVSGAFVPPRKFRVATYYHATTVSPKWSRTLVQVAKVDRHLFYCERSVWMLS